MNALTLLVIFVVLVLVGALVGGALLQYSIEFWGSVATDKPVDVSYLLCALAGTVIGWNIAIPAAIITAVADIAIDEPEVVTQ